MNRDESIQLTARIQEWIGAEAPVLPVDRSPEERLLALRNRFGLSKEEPFFRLLTQNFRLLSADEFDANPYLRAMRELPERIRDGRFTLAMARYEAGELLAYDAPVSSDLAEDEAKDQLMVPRLGCFDRAVRFPAVYEDIIPWMSICPSEMNTLREPIRHARKFVRERASLTTKPQETDSAGTQIREGCRLLVLGLGLGYFPFLLAGEESVSEIVIVEYSPEIIQLFTRHLLPRFPMKEKLRLVQGDAFDYLRGIHPADFDYVFADTWESQFDGAKDYLRIKRQEKRLREEETSPLRQVGFSYWIEPQIRAYIRTELGEEFLE